MLSYNCIVRQYFVTMSVTDFKGTVSLAKILRRMLAALEIFKMFLKVISCFYLMYFITKLGREGVQVGGSLYRELGAQ